MEEASAATSKSTQDIPKFLIPVAVGIILLIIGVLVATLIIREQPQVVGLSKGQPQTQLDDKSLIAAVSKLIALPTTEKPTIATVTDITKLKDQPFFKSAKNGDKVLVYSNAKQAILYRPKENRIIEVGSVNINSTTSPSPAAATSIPSPQPSNLPSPSASPTIKPTPQT